MYGDWRDEPVSNGCSNVMRSCRDINPRTRLAFVVRYLKATGREFDAVCALYEARLTNLVYAVKAVRDLR